MPASRRPWRRSRGSCLGGATPAPLALAALLALGAGCSDAQIDSGFRKVFEPRKTPQQYMLIAVSSDDPDLRRDAVARISKSKQHNADWAIKGYSAIALLEDDPQTRGVAIRALMRAGDPRAVDTLLKILNYAQHPPEEVRPPDDVGRWDATLGLAALSENGAVPEARRDEVRASLIERLRKDRDRHARLEAARGLARYPSEESVRVLIDSLRDPDFAVVQRCETSLVRLTGVTHNCDALDWNAWFEAHREQLFAAAGEVPESRRPPYRNRFEKFGHDSRLLWEWFWPPRKE